MRWGGLQLPPCFATGHNTESAELIGFVFLVVVNGMEHCAVGAELIDSVLGSWRKASSRRVHEDDQAHPRINCRVEARRLHSEVASVGERVVADLFVMVMKFIKDFDGCEG